MRRLDSFVTSPRPRGRHGVPGSDLAAWARGGGTHLLVVSDHGCAGLKEALGLAAPSGITCSIGIATRHRHIAPDVPLSGAKSALLRCADTATCIAKETGRARIQVASVAEVLERMPLGAHPPSTDQSASPNGGRRRGRHSQTEPGTRLQQGGWGIPC